MILSLPLILIDYLHPILTDQPGANLPLPVSLSSAMRPQVLISVLSALSAASAIPLEVSISYLDRTITQTVTVTAGQANPTDGSSKIPLHNWAASGADPQPTITVVSQDALPAPETPGEENQSIGSPAEAAAMPSNTPVQIDESDVPYVPEPMPSRSPGDVMVPIDPAASAGMVTISAPANPGPSEGAPTPIVGNTLSDASAVTETIAGGGYSVVPTPSLMPSDTLSAGSPIITSVAPPIPSGATGCQSAGPVAAGQGKAGLGWTSDSGSCANDFLQPGSKISW